MSTIFAAATSKYINYELGPPCHMLMINTVASVYFGEGIYSIWLLWKQDIPHPLHYSANDILASTPPTSSCELCPSVVSFPTGSTILPRTPYGQVWNAVLSWRGLYGAELTPKWTHHRCDGNRWGSLVHMVSLCSLKQHAPVFLLHSTSASHAPAPPLLFPLQPSHGAMHRNSWIRTHI